MNAFFPSPAPSAPAASTSTSTAPGSSTVDRTPFLNATSFPAICANEYPLTLAVTQFHADLVSRASGLQALAESMVTDITVYHRPGGPVTHDYLILCIRPSPPASSPSTPSSSSPLGSLTRIWARCERNPGSIPGGAAKLSRESAPALDTIKFSVERPKLRAQEDVAIMECAYDRLKVIHVADLLRVVHDVSPRYSLASYNCWWFAALTIGTLQPLGSDWTISPSRDWAKRAVSILGKNTSETSERVARVWGERWLGGVGGGGGLRWVGDEGAWGNANGGLGVSHPVYPGPSPTRRTLPPGPATDAPLPPIPVPVPPLAPTRPPPRQSLPPPPREATLPGRPLASPTTSVPPPPPPRGVSIPSGSGTRVRSASQATNYTIARNSPSPRIPLRTLVLPEQQQAREDPIPNRDPIPEMASLQILQPPDDHDLNHEGSGTPPPEYTLLAADGEASLDEDSAEAGAGPSSLPSSSGAPIHSRRPQSQQQRLRNGSTSGQSSHSHSHAGHGFTDSPHSYAPNLPQATHSAPSSFPPPPSSSPSAQRPPRGSVGPLAPQWSDSSVPFVGGVGGGGNSLHLVTNPPTSPLTPRTSSSSPVSSGSIYSQNTVPYMANAQGQQWTQGAGSVYGGEGYPGSVYEGEGESLADLVWRLLWSTEPRDISVLLSIHPAFTTSADLLRELKALFGDIYAVPDQAPYVQSRIIETLHQWVFSEDFDTSMGSELHDFLARVGSEDPQFRQRSEVRAMAHKLEHLSSTWGDPVFSTSSSSFGHASDPTAPSGGLTRKASTRPLKADSIAKMKDRDLVELAGALELMELDMRANLTVSKAVKWLRWRRSPDAQGPTARPFSTLSDKIAAWVVDSCLEGSMEQRAQTLSKLVIVAERCRDAGNLATLSDLLYGLRSPAIERLEQTRRLAGNVDTKCYELMQLIHPRTPHRLFPLNPRMLAFTEPFNNLILESGLISWARCRSLYASLFTALSPPTGVIPPAVHPSYPSFLSVRIQSALQNARRHNAMSAQIAEDELREKVRRERSAAGMRPRH